MKIHTFFLIKSHFPTIFRTQNCFPSISQFLYLNNKFDNEAGPAQAPNGAAAAPAPGAASAQDFSAEWAEYYRRLGKTDEAEAIEKQIQANKVRFDF